MDFIGNAVKGLFSFFVWTLEFFFVLWVVCTMFPGLFGWLCVGFFIYLIPWGIAGWFLTGK
jgi:hypothetical protein